MDEELKNKIESALQSARQVTIWMNMLRDELSDIRDYMEENEDTFDDVLSDTCDDWIDTIEEYDYEDLCTDLEGARG